MISVDHDWLLVDTISVPDGHRALNETMVKSLMESFEVIGQIMPISCYFDPDAEETVLIAGTHRLEAAKRLGWDRIDAVVMDADALDRDLWTIDENLIRAELTEIERGEHLLRRKEIFDAKGGEKIATLGGKQKIGFAKDTATKTGLSKSTINKALNRNRKIAPDVKKLVKEIRPDAGVSEIEALASLKPDDQRQAVQDVKSGSARNFTDAAEDIKFDQGIEERERMREAFDKLVDKAGKAGELKDRARSDTEYYFKDNVQERIVSLGISPKDLAHLGNLFHEAERRR